MVSDLTLLPHLPHLPHLKVLSGALAACLLGGSTYVGGGASAVDLRPAIAAVQPAHVLVTVTNARGSMYKPRASGILLNDEGFVLTVAQVLDEPVEIEVDVAGQPPVLASFIARDTTQNVAILKIPPVDVQLPRIADRLPAVGEPVVALGNPFDLGRSVSIGHVTGVDRILEDDKGKVEGLLQLSLPVNPGDQGGPVANASGELVALLHSTFNGHVSLAGVVPQGISFAMPLAQAQPWVEIMMQRYRDGELTVEPSEPRRPWMGVRVEEILQPAFRQHLRLGEGVGVLVEEVFAESPAQRAGILPHDVLIAWNDETIRGLQHLSELLRSVQTDDAVVFQVIRDGGRIEITIVIGGRK